MEFGPEVGAYSAVGIALLLLFRTVFRTLAVKDTEVERHMRRLVRERNRAQTMERHAWDMERYQAARVDHWYARALGDPNPPPIPTPPILNLENDHEDDDSDSDPALTPPPDR